MEPRTFTVASDRLVGHDAGDVVTSDELGEHDAVEALVAGGHLEEKTGKHKPDKAAKPEGSE